MRLIRITSTSFFFLLFVCPVFLSAVGAAEKQKSKKIPDKSFQWFKIPKSAPEKPSPKMDLSAFLCTDSDGGANLEIFGSASSPRYPLVNTDTCVAPDPDQGVWDALANWYRRQKGLPPRESPPQRPGPGIHSGSFANELDEAICDPQTRSPSFIRLDCAEFNQSCVEGRCQRSSCSVDYLSNKVRYLGFALDSDGLLKPSPEVSFDHAKCQSDRILSKQSCLHVPMGKYAAKNDIEEGKLFIANQGESYLEKEEQTCRGRDVPLPCTPRWLPAIRVSGCVDKAKIIDKIDDVPFTGRLVERARQAPDFALCAEDLPRECPRSSGASSPGAQGDSGDETGGFRNWAEILDVESEEETSGNRAAPVTSLCLPLDGTEPNNPCSPATNGVKVVAGTHVEFFCNRCSQTNNRVMYQSICNSYDLLERNFVNCPGSKVCSQGRCDACNNFQQTWCGEVVE